jgi:hypothetical protein
MQLTHRQLREMDRMRAEMEERIEAIVDEFAKRKLSADDMYGALSKYLDFDDLKRRLNK